jgi:hypothetical protein
VSNETENWPLWRNEELARFKVWQARLC